MTDEKAVVLTSIKPFESEHMPRSLKSWWGIYAGLLTVIILLFRPGKDTVVIAVLLAIVFGVIIFISRLKNRGNVDKAVEEIRGKKFKLNEGATADEIYAKLETKLPKVYWDNMAREGDKVVVTCEGINYEIILNGDETFSVAGKNSSPPDKKFYNKIRETTPVIAFWLQNAFGLN